VASRPRAEAVLPELVLPQPWQPVPYMKRAVRWLLEHACAGLFLDPGMRKTSITLAAFSVLKKQGLAKKMLVIAPRRVCYEVWPAEVRKWTDFHHLRVVVLHGPAKEARLREAADVYVINPEGLDWLLGAARTRRGNRIAVTTDVTGFRRLGFDVLCVDELTRFKSSTSGRFKILKTVIHLFRYRWGLTGSPAANGLEQLFGQISLLDQGNAFGPYVSHFRQRFFSPIGDFKWVPQAGAEELIYRQLAKLVLRLDADEYLQLPEVVDVDVAIELPDDVRATYDALEQDLLARVGDRTITAKNVGVAVGKCRQVTGGGLYLEPDALAVLQGRLAPRRGKREVLELHTLKTAAALELVEELQGQPVLILYEFAHELARANAVFGEAVPFIAGGVSDRRVAELKAAWNRNELPYLFAQTASVALGLNLQEGHAAHLCHLTPTWDYEYYDQVIRRLRRSGNTATRIFNHRLVAKGTVDVQVLGALRRKETGQRALFAALQRLAKERGY